jgi:hypothetical protein
MLPNLAARCSRECNADDADGLHPMDRSTLIIAGGAVAALALFIYHRQKKRAATELEPEPLTQSQSQSFSAPERQTITIVFDAAEDSSVAVAGLLADTLEPDFACERIDTFNADILHPDELRGGGTFLFVVEVDKEGEAPSARPLTRALRPLRLSDSRALDGTRIAVIALAHSVCAFSAASGGQDKFRGGLRLQNGLVDAGARAVHAFGSAEVEVEEVGESVLPWCMEVKSALQREIGMEQQMMEMMRASKAQLAAGTSRGTTKGTARERRRSRD